VWSRIRPRCATSLRKSIAVAFSNSRSPREYESATDTLLTAIMRASKGLRKLGIAAASEIDDGTLIH